MSPPIPTGMTAVSWLHWALVLLALILCGGLLGGLDEYHRREACSSPEATR